MLPGKEEKRHGLFEQKVVVQFHDFRPFMHRGFILSI